MSKSSSEELVRPGTHNASDILARSESQHISSEKNSLTIPAAQLLGHPEGPFGTAIVFKSTILLRSVGAARFAKFETQELAPHGIFVVVQALASQPYQTKSTLLEFQLFLGEPQDHSTQLIKGVAKIEELRNAVDLPTPAPSGYVLRILQISAQELKTLENFVHEQLLKAAM